MVDIVGAKETLEKLEARAMELQAKGKYLECLEVMQEVLTIKKQQFGEESLEVISLNTFIKNQFQKSSEKLCELCNLIAMIFLQKGIYYQFNKLYKEKFDTSIEFLKKAEILSFSSLNFRSITLNNLACYYRRIGKLRAALGYLQQALQIEIKLDNPQTLSDTHLNLCAVQSSLNKHDDALQHALMAIMMLQDEFMSLKLQSNKKEENAKQSDVNKKLEERCPVLAIAYHNLGVELEYLKRVQLDKQLIHQYDEAIKIYQKAVNFAQTNLGEHPLIENLQNVLQQAEQQVIQSNQIQIEVFFNQKQRKQQEKNGNDNNFIQIKLTNEITIYCLQCKNQQQKQQQGKHQFFLTFVVVINEEL